MRRAGVILLFGVVVAGFGAAIWYFFWTNINEADAILFTGFVGGVIALWGVFSQRAISRREITFEHIARLEADPQRIANHRKFRELAKQEDGLGLAKWATLENAESQEAQVIFTVLNEFELISIGIQRGIIDYEIFSRWFKTGTINKWNDAAAFVAILRRRAGPNLYHEFEQMAEWFNRNKPPRRVWWLGWIT
jgi:hypothetical protein